MNFKFPAQDNTPTETSLLEIMRELYDDVVLREVVHRHLLLCTCDHSEECGILWDLCHVREGCFITRDEFITRWTEWERCEIAKGEALRKTRGDGLPIPTQEERLRAFQQVVETGIGYDLAIAEGIRGRERTVDETFMALQQDPVLGAERGRGKGWGSDI